MRLPGGAKPSFQVFYLPMGAQKEPFQRLSKPFFSFFFFFVPLLPLRSYQGSEQSHPLHPAAPCPALRFMCRAAETFLVSRGRVQQLMKERLLYKLPERRPGSVASSSCSGPSLLKKNFPAALSAHGLLP